MSGSGFVWESEHAEELRKMACKFKSAGDMVGVYLCAATEAEIDRWKMGTIDCPAVAVLLLGIVQLRIASGADHELAHLLVPQIQELMATAQHDAKLDILKREVGIG